MFNNVEVKSVLDDSLVNDIPTTEVFVDTVTDPKNISKVILELNSRFPLPELHHLKRMKAKKVLLFPCEGVGEKEVHEILKKRGFQVDLLLNEIERTSVAVSPPLLRHQYLKCHADWPCNFHTDKYLEKVFTNTLFEDRDLKRISIFMSIAEEVGVFSGDSPGVVIVDPKMNSIVAVGYDETQEGSVRHSVMVAIDNVAKSQMGGAWIKTGDQGNHIENNLNLNGIPQNVLVQLKQKYTDVSFGASLFIPRNGDPEGPYLCTGYDVYTVKEPCIMCAMALIHSRIKRVFYNTPSENGALGTLCKIHRIKDLNHHYEVFIVDKH